MAKLSYIGKGVAYPVTLQQGAYKTVTGTELIKGSITMILTTPVGSRYFNPSFGSRLNELLWEPNDLVLAASLRDFTADAISKWEKRIELRDVSVVTSIDAALIIIVYRIKNSNEFDSFVYPFVRRAA